MTILNCRIPVVDKRSPSGAQNPFYLYQGLPTLESDPEVDGAGCTAALFAYLTQIWLKTCLQPAPVITDQRFGVQGDGVINLTLDSQQANCSAAIVDIQFLPDDIDMVFGQPPLIYPGVCGFGFQSDVGISVQVGERTFALGVSASPIAYGKMQYMNHIVQAFFPENPILNCFWYHFKSGVVANIICYGAQVGAGASCITGGTVFNNGLGILQHFNPLAGGFNPYDEGVDIQPRWDGGGNLIN